MANKKITELPALSQTTQDDLLLVIDTPGGTPAGRKIAVGDFFSNVTFITSSTPGVTVIGSYLTANVNTAASQVLAAGTFDTNALSTSQNTAYQYGIQVTSRLSGATANVLTEHASGKFTLDVSNAAALITNTYGLAIKTSNTGTRAAQPTAFIRLEEQLTGVNALSTKYALTINCAANTTAGNTTYMFGGCTANTATHKLKVQINGTDYFLLLSSS